MKSATGNRILRRNNLLLISATIIGAYVVTRLYSEKQLRAEISLLAELLELNPGQAVAEVGAGQGKMTIAMASKVGPRGQFFSTEIDPQLVAKIRRAVQAARLDNVTVLTASASDAGLPENCCDAIFLRGVYHHLTRPWEFDRSLWKALRPGGHLAIIDFPPKLILWPWRPKGVPQNRGGHGIPEGILIDELIGADFQVQRIVRNWPGGKYCVLFRKPTQVLETM